MDGDVCFSPQALALLGGIWVVIQGVIVYLFRGWLGSLKEQLVAERATCSDALREAREQRDRALKGWEDTVGLGEQAVRRERRRP